jgi:PadR family transcriptional regulator, regulatory protein PadR
MGSEPRMTMQVLAILKVLLARPLVARYALELGREAGLQPGTFYPALTRLERAGWLESWMEDIDESAEGRRRRRYYRLTAEGAAKARNALETATRQLAPTWLPSPGVNPGGAGA